MALNGDIDNYPELKQQLAEQGCLIDSRVTTDTKIIPLIVERYLLEGHDLRGELKRRRPESGEGEEREDAHDHP